MAAATIKTTILKNLISGISQFAFIIWGPTFPLASKRPAEACSSP